MKYPLKTIDAVRGVISAIIIISVWLSSLIFSLTIHIEHLAIWLIILMIIWQTFLYTGLFITAHDAMHGTAFFKNKDINKIIGMLAVLLYAMFSYKKLLTKHHQHHKSPGTRNDPDFHDGIHKGFWKWYIHFLFNYLTWEQFLIMGLLPITKPKLQQGGILYMAMCLKKLISKYYNIGCFMFLIKVL